MSIQAKIDELEKKLKQAKELAKKQAARDRLKTVSANRKLENKQKFLMGSFVLEKMKDSQMNPAFFTMSGQDFGDWLTRDNERAAFGLEPIKLDSHDAVG